MVFVRFLIRLIDVMKCFVSKFGAYTKHLASLSENKSIKNGDCGKLKGFYKNGPTPKYLLGCALFIDLLKPCAIFFKAIPGRLHKYFGYTYFALEDS